MKPREPRPPVAEQGMSRAYREGRVQDPEPVGPATGWRLFFGWVAVVIGGAAYSGFLAFDLFIGGSWSWLLLIGATGTLVGSNLLGTTARRWWILTGRRQHIAFICGMASLAAWFALSLVASYAWRWHGLAPAVVMGIVGIVPWIATFWAARRGHVAAAA